MANFESMKDRIQLLVDKFGDGKNTIFAKKIGVAESNIRSYINGVSPKADILTKIAKTCDINPMWLLTGEGPMIIESEAAFSNIKPMSVEIETRPRIPFDAAAGSLSTAMQAISSGECEQIPLIPTLPRYDFTIIARGDSMYPEFQSGDELACAFVHETSFIQWGRAHILDTAQGVVLKKIFDHKTSILCRSINSDYPDFDIPKNEVYHLAIVVGLIRHF